MSQVRMYRYYADSAAGFYRSDLRFHGPMALLLFGLRGSYTHEETLSPHAGLTFHKTIAGRRFQTHVRWSQTRLLGPPGPRAGRRRGRGRGAGAARGRPAGAK